MINQHEQFNHDTAMTDKEIINNIALPETTPSDVLQLSLTATKIALENFEWHYATLVFFNSSLWHGVQVFLENYKKSIIVGKCTHKPKFETRQYVLFEKTISDMDKTLNWMQSRIFDNTGKFIVVCQTSDCDETEAVQVFWNYKITNIVFMKSIEQQVFGYTYFPLNDSCCTCNKPTKLNLKRCIDNADSTFCSNIFFSKLENMNACDLVASTFIQTPYMKIVNGTPTGSDGDLLRLIAGAMNATLKVMTPKIGNGWGKLEKDNTWSGSLADLYHDYANLSITSAALTLARFSYFQMSNDYNTVTVAWVTHPAKLLPSSLKLTHPFQLSAQIALILSFFLIVLCAFLIRSRFWLVYCKPINVKRPRSSVLFYSWMIFMGLPSTKLPTKTALLYVVLLWMWFGILMRTFYQVSLITVLQGNFYFDEFDSIEEAIEAEYPFGGGPALKDYFIDYPPVFDHWEDVDAANIVPTMRNLSKGLEFVLASNMETAKSIIWQEKIHLHVLSRKIVVSPTVIFFKKFSPLAAPINRILISLVESGIEAKLYKKYTNRKVIQDTGDTKEPINIEHYTGCYFVLICGWIISFVLFIFELLFFKLYRK